MYNKRKSRNKQVDINTSLSCMAQRKIWFGMSPNGSKKNTLYDENSIISEDPRTFCRRVPSTYLGSSRTNTNLIKEIFANAVDEHFIGHGDYIRILIDTKNNIYEIEDNGQGFLVNTGIDKNKKTILQRSFDTLNTSGKTSTSGVYGGTALGLNGIGAKLTNWLSKKLHVITYRDGQFEEIWFEDGLFKERKVGKVKHASGTIVTWSPDPQFFGVNAPDITALKAHFELIAAMCPKLTIDLEYNGEKTKYTEPDGLEGYVVKKVGDKEIIPERFTFTRTLNITEYIPTLGMLHLPPLSESDFDKNGCHTYGSAEVVQYNALDHTPLHMEEEQIVIKKSDCEVSTRKETINICITYIDGYSENLNAYVNLGYTEGGAHINAFHTAFARAINKYAKEANILKKSDSNFSSAEISEGLYVVFNLTTTTAKYDAQNKSRIDDIDSTIINTVIGGDFATWLANNPTCVKTITEKAITARKARDAAQKAKEKIREASNGKGTKSVFADLPTKLSDAYPEDKRDRSKCELYLVEGDSAASSINSVKNSKFQACFPLRGKVLNVRKATVDKIYGNAEIANIVKALGLEINKKTHKLIFDEKKLRYTKIIIATDEDADGLAIANLLITAIYWLCPELIEFGYVYHVHGALYKVTFNDKTYQLFQTDAELNAWKKKNKKPYTLSRAKGLGELTKEETYEQLINPATRNLHLLVAKNMNQLDEYLELFEGNTEDPRRQYLEEHCKDYEE